MQNTVSKNLQALRVLGMRITGPMTVDELLEQMARWRDPDPSKPAFSKVEAVDWRPRELTDEQLDRFQKEWGVDRAKVCWLQLRVAFLVLNGTQFTWKPGEMYNHCVTSCHMLYG